MRSNAQINSNDAKKASGASVPTSTGRSTTNINNRKKIKCDREKKRRNGMNESFGELMGLLLLIDPEIGGCRGDAETGDIMAQTVVPTRDLLPRADLVERACEMIRKLYQEKEEWKTKALNSEEKRKNENIKNAQQAALMLSTPASAVVSRNSQLCRKNFPELPLSAATPVASALPCSNDRVTPQQQSVQTAIGNDILLKLQHQLAMSNGQQQQQTQVSLQQHNSISGAALSNPHNQAHQQNFAEAPSYQGTQPQFQQQQSQAQQLATQSIATQLLPSALSLLQKELSRY